MKLSESGVVVAECWREIPQHFPNVELDAFVIMPNHVHGIVFLTGDSSVVVGARHGVPLQPHAESFGKPISGSLPTIIRSFKAAATRRIYKPQGRSRDPVWQRNYYEHIIRNDDSLNRIREYVLFNPARWAEDENHPLNLTASSKGERP